MHLTSNRDWWCAFDTRSIFDPVMRGQRSNFQEVDFSNLHEYISKAMNRSDKRLFTSVFLVQL